MEKTKDFLKKHDLTEKQFLGKEEFKSSLDLSSLTSIPEGFNPTVGGYLDLRSLCFDFKQYKQIKLDNNFISAFKEYQQLKNKGFKLIMFDNCIFYVSLCPEIFNNFKTIN